MGRSVLRLYLVFALSLRGWAVAWVVDYGLRLLDFLVGLIRLVGLLVVFGLPCGWVLGFGFWLVWAGLRVLRFGLHVYGFWVLGGGFVILADLVGFREAVGFGVWWVDWFVFGLGMIGRSAFVFVSGILTCSLFCF